MAAVLSIDTTTNRRSAAAGEGGDDDETRPRRNAWGWLIPVIWGGKWGDKKKRDWTGRPGLSLKQPPLAQPKQQPTKNSTSNGAGNFDKILRWNVGGGWLPIIFDGDLSNETYNEKIHSVAIDSHQMIKRHMTTNQRQCWWWGEVLWWDGTMA